MKGARVRSVVATSPSRGNVFVNRCIRPQVGQSIQARSIMGLNFGCMGEACQALRGTSRPKSYVFAVKCEGANPSLIAIRAAPHQQCTRTPVGLNPLRDRQKRLGGIVSLIALNGPLSLECQVSV